MRHSLIRIFLALLIGLWAPLCCCQAVAIVGHAGVEADVPAEIVDERHACCGGCKSAEDETDQPDPASHADPACPECPSCTGPVSAAGFLGVAKPTLEFDLAHVSTLWLVMLTPVETLAGSPAEPREIPAAVPTPVLRANRQTLRWHCALMV